MKFSEFTADIKDSLKQYSFAGMIDDMRIHDWVSESLKQFRNLIGTRIETTIEVKNGKAKLPSGFILLEDAHKCEPYVYTCDDEDEHDILQDFYFYRVRETTSTEWQRCNPCDVVDKDSCIIEKYYLHDGRKAEFYHRNPQRLQVISHVKNAKYERRDQLHLISIKGQFIYCNFKEGNIYIRYKGLELDEDGFIEIPETDRGYMLKYLSYMVKRNIMEELIINSDTVTNEQTLYQLFAQKEEEFYSKTETELKFKGLNLGISKYARRIKSEFKLYNI